MLKIGLFTDCHTSDLACSCRTRRPSLSYEKIKAAMMAFVHENVDLVVCLGDLVDHCQHSEDEERELRRIAEMIRSFGKEFYCIRGNHDCNQFSFSQFYTISQFDPIPFSKTIDDQLLIFLDACYGKNGEPYQPGMVDWTDSFVPPESVARLKQTLENAEASAAYVFLHQRLDVCKDVRYQVSNAQEIRKILQQSEKVRKVFCGHYHPGDRTWIENIEYITFPAMCEGEKNEYFIFVLKD